MKILLFRWKFYFKQKLQRSYKPKSSNICGFFSMIRDYYHNVHVFFSRHRVLKIKHMDVFDIMQYSHYLTETKCWKTAEKVLKSVLQVHNYTVHLKFMYTRYTHKEGSAGVGQLVRAFASEGRKFKYRSLQTWVSVSSTATYDNDSEIVTFQF